MQTVRWKVIRKPLGESSAYEKRCMGIIMQFATPKSVALEFVDTGSEEALALEATAEVNVSQRYPVVVIVENDGTVGAHIRQPDPDQLEALHRRFGSGKAVWGGKAAGEYIAPPTNPDTSPQAGLAGLGK